MIKKNLGTEDGIQWIELTSEDHDIFEMFDGSVFGITNDNRILDRDGFPCVESDYETIAVRRFI